jgi:hypothetical protein
MAPVAASAKGNGQRQRAQAEKGFARHLAAERKQPIHQKRRSPPQRHQPQHAKAREQADDAPHQRGHLRA